MTIESFIQAGLLLLATLGLTPLVGAYLARVYAGERTWPGLVLGPLERGLYAVSGIEAEAEHDWRQYLTVLVVVSGGLTAALFALVSLQGVLPANPQALAGLAPDLALNVAISFATSTNWQAYAAESALSPLSQVLGLSVANFVSAAIAMAAGVAVIRGLVRRSAGTLGNAWVDMTRSVLYVLLPLSLLLALLFVSQGAVQSLGDTVAARTVAGGEQFIARGPAASQEAIKLLGGNGGGYFNANSAHPFENPTPLTNALTVLACLLIPAGFTALFGRMAGSQRQGWVLFGVMAVLLVTGFVAMTAIEQAGNPLLSRAADQSASTGQSGGNFEGKEVRYGIGASTLLGAVATGTAAGPFNASYDSFLPLSGGLLMLNMQLGEVIFGGPGTGLATMLGFAILAVFLGGQLVGRAPEFLGKKIEPREIMLVVIALLGTSLVILVPVAIAVSIPAGRDAIGNPGAHGFSEILYAYTSAVANNGSSFAGLAANTPFYNLTLAAAMLAGRFLIIAPLLALAGSLAARPSARPSLATLPTDGLLFGALLLGTIVVVGGLTFLPALALGPIAEQIVLAGG